MKKTQLKQNKKWILKSWISILSFICFEPSNLCPREARTIFESEEEEQHNGELSHYEKKEWREQHQEYQDEDQNENNWNEEWNKVNENCKKKKQWKEKNQHCIVPAGWAMGRTRRQREHDNTGKRWDEIHGNNWIELKWVIWMIDLNWMIDWLNDIEELDEWFGDWCEMKGDFTNCQR